MSSMRSITEAQEWEQTPFLREGGIFLQSHPHKKLFEDMGQKTWLLELPSEKGDIRALVTKVEARRGTFLYLPYGPLVQDPLEQAEELKAFFAELRKLAKEEQASFIRISPFWEEHKEHDDLLKAIGFKKAPIHMLAETLWWVELGKKTEDEIMNGMEKKHRNLVRRAIKEGVEIRKRTDLEAIDTFWDLYSETFKRHNFTPYPKKLIQNQLQHFSESEQAMVLEARYGDEVLASALIMYYGEIAAYHHGASTSDPKFRKIPASYLLQWEAIKEAKQRGAQHYSFWGIAPYDLDENGKRVYQNPNHPFCGITHFKTGFGGKRVDLTACHDMVLSPKYYLNWGIESYRKWRRGF